MSSSSQTESPPLEGTSLSGQLRPGQLVSDSDVAMNERSRAIDRFMAKAEISMATRNLRFRLSYASYKATHNVSHVSLEELEARRAISTTSFPQGTRTSLKRKAGSSTSNLHAYPGSQTSVARSPSPTKRPTNGIEPSAPGISLFTALIGPSTEIQSGDIQGTRERRLSTPHSSRTQSSNHRRRAMSTTDRPQKTPKNKSKARSKAKQGDQTDEEIVPAGTVSTEKDLKAAATLTSLLLQSRSPRTSIASLHSSPRSSMALPAASPRSSMAIAALGAPTRPSSALAAPAPNALSPLSSFSSASGSTTQPVGEEKTPSAKEAADLMLFLATSPSPARTVRAAVSPNNVASRGRVLFATEHQDENGSLGGGEVLATDIDDPFIRNASNLGLPSTRSYDVSMARTPPPASGASLHPESTLGAGFDLVT